MLKRVAIANRHHARIVAVAADRVAIHRDAEGRPRLILPPVAPPDRTAATAHDLAASEHVVVQYGGHELLPDAEVQDLVLAFLDGKPERKPIVLPPWVVRTIPDARQPPRRPGG